MSATPQQEPWDYIQALVEKAESTPLGEYLDTLPPADVARAISRLDEETQANLLILLEPEDAADLLDELSNTQGADLVEDLPAERAAAIVDEMDSDQRVDILGEMDEDDAEAILRKMHPEEAQEARELLAYPPDTAGGLMVKEFVVYPQGHRVSDVLKDLRTNAEAYSDIGVQYAYVRSESGTLIGVLRLRDLVLSPSDQPIQTVMIVNPVSVLVNAPLEELEQLFDRYMFSGLPVIEANGSIVGVVQRADVEEAHSERSDRTFMRFSGIIGGDELRSMPLVSRSAPRLAWLGVNLLLSIVAAFVIILYHETVETIIFLAAAIPVLVNVSGCSGNQAVAVTIREMALGLVRPRDFLLVIRKELGVGLINGIVLGIVFGCFAGFYDQNIMLGVVVGVALMLNMVLAVALGGAIPLLLRRMHVDPALAAAPMLTTVVDMCGFFLILFLAHSFVH